MESISQVPAPSAEQPVGAATVPPVSSRTDELTSAAALQALTTSGEKTAYSFSISGIFYWIISPFSLALDALISKILHIDFEDYDFPQFDDEREEPVPVIAASPPAPLPTASCTSSPSSPVAPNTPVSDLGLVEAGAIRVEVPADGNCVYSSFIIALMRLYPGKMFEDLVDLSGLDRSSFSGNNLTTTGKSLEPVILAMREMLYNHLTAFIDNELNNEEVIKLIAAGTKIEDIPEPEREKFKDITLFVNLFVGQIEEYNKDVDTKIAVLQESKKTNSLKIAELMKQRSQGEDFTTDVNGSQIHILYHASQLGNGNINLDKQIEELEKKKLVLSGDFSADHLTQFRKYAELAKENYFYAGSLEFQALSYIFNVRIVTFDSKNTNEQLAVYDVQNTDPNTRLKREIVMIFDERKKHYDLQLPCGY